MSQYEKSFSRVQFIADNDTQRVIPTVICQTLDILRIKLQIVY
jgi:hypothetical protein